MVQQICPACGNAIKIGKKFCTSCGTKLSEVNATETTSGAPPQLQTTDDVGDLLIKGWEVSPDRIDKYQKVITESPIGAPIITSKCKLDRNNGLLIVSDNGFAWRIQMGMSTSMYSAGKSKWVRWHDVANIMLKKPGVILVELKIRKKGSLLLDGKGNPKIKRWKFTLQQNKGEQRDHFIQRQQDFNNIMSEIFNRNKVETDPTTSDSRM